MKKILSAIMMAVLGVTGVMADNNTDDENPGGWDFQVPGLTVKSGGSKTEVKASLSSDFSFGFIGGVSQAENVSIDMGESFEIEWGNVISSKVRVGKKDFARIGLGFDWRNYRVTDFYEFHKDTEGIITMQRIPVGAEPSFSRIHTFSLSIPLKYYHYFNKKTYFAVGPELYFTPYGSLKTRYYMDGEKLKITSGNVHQNRFSVGVGAEFIVRHVGVYYKYNPFHVLRSSYGPSFSSMTVGIKVAF
jgi:hypothetical protein